MHSAYTFVFAACLLFNGEETLFLIVFTILLSNFVGILLESLITSSEKM